MKRVDGLSLGWIDSGIRELLRTSQGLLAGFPHALITCIDSSRDMLNFQAAYTIMDRYKGARPLGRGLVVPADRLTEIGATFNFFTGFDEVWWFNTEPTIEKPDDIKIVGALNLETDNPPAGLANWMH